jgi:hypothetical protein
MEERCKKLFNKWNVLTIMMIAMMSVCVVSCSKDDEGSGNGLSGLYYYDAGGGSRTAYNFVNGNTVEVYGVMTQNPNDTYKGEKPEKFPLRSGWYCWWGNKHVYDYYIEGNMIVVDYDRLFEIKGNTLYYYNMDVVLYKWN